MRQGYVAAAITQSGHLLQKLSEGLWPDRLSRVIASESISLQPKSMDQRRTAMMNRPANDARFAKFHQPTAPMNELIRPAGIRFITMATNRQRRKSYPIPGHAWAMNLIECAR